MLWRGQPLDWESTICLDQQQQQQQQHLFTLLLPIMLFCPWGSLFRSRCSLLWFSTASKSTQVTTMFSLLQLRRTAGVQGTLCVPLSVGSFKMWKREDEALKGLEFLCFVPFLLTPLSQGRHKRCLCWVQGHCESACACFLVLFHISLLNSIIQTALGAWGGGLEHQVEWGLMVVGSSLWAYASTCRCWACERSHCTFGGAISPSVTSPWSLQLSFASEGLFCSTSLVVLRRTVAAFISSTLISHHSVTEIADTCV